MKEKEIETFYPASSEEWRKWLEKNHRSKPSIWLVQHKKNSGKPTISWSEAVDEALCFGWIDSTRKTLDDQTFIQFFTKRKPKSSWSKVNKDKVKMLIEEGRMTEAGLACIEIAKQNGSWTILDAVEELTVPEELQKALKERPGAEEFFLGLSKSGKKMFLHRIAFAKREETKQKRIVEIVEQCARGERPV